MGTSPKLHVVTPQYAALPLELRALHQWVVWKRVIKPGAPKPTKIPYCARTGTPASTTDPATWGTFDEVVAAAGSTSGYDGIGFVFTVNDPYVGIDLDHCLDAATGKLKADAQGIVASLDSYTERTPSGEGLYIIVRGKLPPGGRKKGDVEMYESGRYFTMTGAAWLGTTGTVEHRATELCAVHARVFGQSPRGKASGQDSSVDPTPSARTDAEVLAAIRASSRGPTFEALFTCQWTPPAHPSQSEADLALAAAACPGMVRGGYTAMGI